MNGPRGSRGKHRLPPSQSKSRGTMSSEKELKDEDEEDIEELLWESTDDERDFWIDSYWVDIATHPLYRQGCSILDVVNVQSALLVAIDHGYEDIASVLLDNGAQVIFYRGKHRTQGPVPRFPEQDFVMSNETHLLYFVPLSEGTPSCPSSLLLLGHSVGPQKSALKLAVLREDESMVRFILGNGFKVQ
ncbi:hypothetical protein N8T08_006817 [Aspergillus melleus]|uniref:Uncharacterized protein n=1 Tax=Aspergillus melleus TaxID=138277 RepID=A0ACC3AZ84_9EURO|nr:hypothetical protein N8T08_006817 [Aspergillus melleus]